MKNIEKVSIITFILILLLAACGNEKAKMAEEPKDDNSKYTYESEFQFFYTDDVPYEGIFAEDGTIFFATYKSGIGSKLFYLPLDEHDPREISLESEDGKWITGMGRDIKGNLLFASGLYEEGLEYLELIKVSVDGKVLETVEVTDIFKEIEGFEANYLLGDEEDNYYIGSGKSIYAIDSSGDLLYKLETEKNISDMFFTREGNMMLAHVGELEEILPDKKALKPVKSDIFFKNGIYETGREKELIFSSNDILYTCDVKDGELTEILNWINNDINSLDLKCFTVLADGRIAAFTSTEAGGRAENEFVLLTRMEQAQVQEKTVLTYGCAYSGSTTNTQILRFNKLNKEYRVEIKQYGDEYSDIETRKKLLQMDIITGKAPDILDIGMKFSESERYEFIEMGILEDLNPYFAKDEGIQKEDYVESVLSMYESQDGIYALMPTFGLEFLVGRTDDLGTGSSWSMKEMMELIDSQPAEKLVLPEKNRSDVLHTFLTLNFQDFVDWETGECYFNRAEFKQLLEFVSRFPKEKEGFSYHEHVEQIRNGEVLLLETSALKVQDLQTMDFVFGESVNNIGYPTSSGNGVIASPCVSVLAIGSGSEKKEGAWKFIRYMLEESQQFEMGISGSLGFPIKKSALDLTFEKAMEVEYEEDEEGNIQERSRYSMSIGGNRETGEAPDFSVSFYAATEEDVTSIRELIDSIGNSMKTNMDDGMFDIIMEEAEAFFEGQKSVDEVTSIIQNRVQIYVNEKEESNY